MMKFYIAAKFYACRAVQVSETLPPEILEKMHAPPKPNVPEVTIDNLVEADALMFGMPTRFGMMPTQLKALFDRTGSLW